MTVPFGLRGWPYERDEVTDDILGVAYLFYEGQPIDFLGNNDSFIGYSNSVDGFSWSGYAIPGGLPHQRSDSGGSL